MLGVSCIAVNPIDTNIIYIALSIGSQYQKSSGYELGMAYTTDGGNSWNTDTALDNATTNGLITNVTKVAYMPGTQKLFALCDGNKDSVYATKIMYKADAISSWTDITPDSVKGNSIFDLDFSNQNKGKAVISVGAKNDSSSLWVYDTTAGGTWSFIKIGFPYPYYQYDYYSGAQQISISGQDTAYMRLAISDTTTKQNLTWLYKTSLTSFDAIELSDSFQAASNRFIVSKSNSEVIYSVSYSSGNHHTFQISIDEGRNNSFVDYAQDRHPDGRCLYLYSDSSASYGLYDVVYYGSDGGINKKRSGNMYPDCISGDSLAITEFYGVGNTEADDNIMAGGAQDNGGFGFIKTNPVPWTLFKTSNDGYNAKFMGNGVKDAIGEYNSKVGPYPIYHANFSGSSITISGLATPQDLALSNLVRPIYFDTGNTAYIGYSFVWKKDMDSSTWKHCFTADPINHGTDTFRQMVVDFYIDPKNNNNAYIAYWYTPDNGITLDSIGKLYFSSNAANPPFLASWTNITPFQVQYDGINSIAVDPNNSNRIWVALGNISSAYVTASPDTMKNRILYSDDAGNNWQDVSKGLPMLPVNKLLYRKGSDDVLFAGTDVGVFIWNKGLSSWQCFNTGLPMCIVSDMEFNYCAGKLRIATYGRGMWESDMFNVATIPLQTDTITTNTTWDGANRYITGGILVDSGATLTIQNSVIHMPKNGLIKVMPGAGLIISNDTLTNDCSQCFWGGIEAVGDSSLTQHNSANQAWVQIKNGSVLQHAINAVSNWDGSDFGTTGGIIQASNSYFINNRLSADFEPYQNGPGNMQWPDLSNFINCVFEIDSNYKGTSTNNPFSAMVSANGVYGLSFQGCKFKNNHTGAFKGLGYGIYSFDAGVEVEPLCLDSSPTLGSCSNLQRSCFKWFTEGVHIAGSMGLYPASVVDQANFDSCSLGIRVVNVNTASLTRNNFYVGEGRPVADFDSSSCHQNIGILTENSNQFRIEGNSFYGKNYHSWDSSGYIADWANFGVVVENSMYYSNMVYNNSFSGLDFGCYTRGVNYAVPYPLPNIGHGLSILCNSFSNDTVDIYVSNDGVLQNIPSINNLQGSMGSPASNLFLTGGSIYNAGHSFEYYYDSTNISQSLPANTTGPVMYMPGGPASSCPLSYDVNNTSVAGKANPSKLSCLKNSFYAYDDSLSANLGLYNSLMDAGNTDSLDYVINHASSAAALYTSLMMVSPYLSGTSLKVLSQKTLLNHTQYMTVLSANPEALRTGGLIDSLQASEENTLSDDDVRTLNTAALNSTARSTLEGHLYCMSNARATNAQDVLRALKEDHNTGTCYIVTDTNSIWYGVDSNSSYVYFDSIGVWLQNINTLWSQYDLVGYYSFLDPYHRTGLADSALGHAPDLYSGDDAASAAEYGHYETVWGVLKELRASGRNIEQLTDSEKTVLSSIDDTVGADKASMIAHAATSTGLSPHLSCMALPFGFAPKHNPKQGTVNSGNAGNTSNPIAPVSSLRTNCSLSVYPNPASSNVNFSYQTPESEGTIVLSITDAVGAEIKHISVTNNAGIINWDIQTIASGVYIYTLSDANGMIGMGKIVVVK